MVFYYKFWCPECGWKYMKANFRIPQKTMQDQVCWTCGWKNANVAPPAAYLTEVDEQTFNAAPPGKKFDYVN